MKKTILFISILFFCCSYISSKDSINNIVKIGYINKEEILSNMPQVVVIEKEIEQLEKEYEDEFINMTKEYERKVKAYLEKNEVMSEPIKLAKQTEITELEARMSMYKKRYKEEIRKRKDEKYKPIIDQINIVIKEVCVENNITIAFDSAQPIYMSSQCLDLTEIVKEKFGI